MKFKFVTRGILLSSMVASTALYATNGDTLMGVGVKTRAMGGAGIAYSHGAESVLVNPAAITSVEGHEISFGATIFMPSIDTTLPTPGGMVEKSSKADLSLIPSVSLAQKLTEHVYIGTGMWGTAGMGVDFKNNPSHMNMRTQLQLMQFAVPIAYKTGGLSIAVAPVVQYGSLDISYTNMLSPGMPKPQVGAGVSDDFGYGVDVGLLYAFDNGFSIGAVYKSQIEMVYTGQLTDSAGAMGILLPDGDHLDQPAEYGVGLSYSNSGHTFALDYKRITWSDAAGYKVFGWEDQDVFAVGYQYAQGNWAIRLGYNHANSPVKANPNPAINMFNLLGFPATSEDHYTLGGSYAFSEDLTLDLAIVYSPESKTSFTLAPMMPAPISNKHSELSTSFQLTYTF